MYIIKASSCSLKGNFRENNEDNYYVNGEYMPREHIDGETVIDIKDDNEAVFAVFDGLGGEDKGEVASYTAAAILDEHRVGLEMESYFRAANESVCALRDERSKKMVGTTACIVYINGGVCQVANIGDSKIYLIRDGVISQLSEDHTMLAAMINSGMISERDIVNFNLNNSLSQCLGIDSSDMMIKPYISEPIEIKNEDVFIICSDGVSNCVSREELCKLVNSVSINVAESIVCKAVENGTKDNATAVVARVLKGTFNVFMHKLRGDRYGY